MARVYSECQATPSDNRRLSLLHFPAVVYFEAYGRAEAGRAGPPRPIDRTHIAPGPVIPVQGRRPCRLMN
jgi:hypothetical protein